MIVVFGSIVLDLVFAPERLPRAGETVLTDDYQLIPGGKGANQTLAAARAEADVRFLGSVGDDPFGVASVRNLEAAGVDLRCLAQSKLPTACAAVSVDRSGENQIVVALGANLDTSVALFERQPLRRHDICVLQMEITPEENWNAIEMARSTGAKSILNVAPFSPVPVDCLRSIDVLIVNEIEAAMLADQLKIQADVPTELAATLSRQYDLTAVVTLGAHGAVASRRDQHLVASSLDIEAVDTVGAGDAFVGAFAAAMHAGCDLADCLRRASVAGGLTCLTPGAQEGLPDAGAIAAHLGEIVVSTTR